jgi:hypothetical protein
MQQALEERKSGYQGRSLQPRVGYAKKSAEVIVLGATSYQQKGIGLTNKEGLNAKWFLIFNGMVQTIALKNKNRLTKNLRL